MPTVSPRLRPTALVAVVLLSATAGGAASLGIGKASGWLGSGRAVVLETAAGAGPAGAAPADTGATRSLAGNGFDPAAIYEGRSHGVVTIYALFPDHGDAGAGAEAQGSGFVVSPQGYILTNSHVITTAGDGSADATVEAATEIWVELSDGDRVPASIVGWDLFDDVGLLRIDPKDHRLEPVPLGDSSAVAVGEPVAAIGSPFGQVGSLAVGVVSATGRSVSSLTSAYAVVDAIQIDAPINRGNSGGPLFNARGEVIGINAQIRSESGNAEGVGFAIPINSARRSMEQLIETGRVRYAWLGIGTQTLTSSLAHELGYDVEHGALIQDVRSGSPAARAGLRAGTEIVQVEGTRLRRGGDIVVAVDGAPVETTEDLIRLVAGTLAPGQTANVTVIRGGKRLVVPVVLAERPANPDAAR